MDQEVAEILGMKRATLMVSGGTVEITLRPLTMRQQTEASQQNFATEQTALEWVLYQSAKRGGFEGTQDEFADLLEGDEVLQAAEVYGSLCPLTVQAVATVMLPPSPETDSDSSGD